MADGASFEQTRSDTNTAHALRVKQILPSKPSCHKPFPASSDVHREPLDVPLKPSHVWTIEENAHLRFYQSSLSDWVIARCTTSCQDEGESNKGLDNPSKEGHPSEGGLACGVHHLLLERLPSWSQPNPSWLVAKCKARKRRSKDPNMSQPS